MNFSKKLTYLASVLALVALGTGCEITVTTDFDGDGIEDGADDCPGTSLADAVDAFGCSIEDDDGDGVLNDMDDCPSEAGTLANGCNAAVNDQDGDGVVDSLDACPTVFGDGADGCPIVEELGTLDGMWLINGAAANAQLCAEAGIANVRFNVNTADTLGDASWEMPCANQLFDSRVQADEPTIEFNVAYTSFWEALDADGVVIAMTDPLDLVLNNPPQHATVSTADFLITLANEMTVPLFWQEAIGSDVYGTCADAMLTAPGDNITIMLYIAGEGSPLYSDVEVACTDTLVFHEDDFPTLAAGSYELDIAATRASDGLKWGTGATSCGIEYDGGAQLTDGCDIDIEID